VNSGAQSGRTLDKNIRFGRSMNTAPNASFALPWTVKTQELAGELSAPIRVEALDIFPPAVPLASPPFATAGDTSTEPSIDLSWQPVTDPDLSGYAVYRSESGGAWRRVSPDKPIVPPAYHDAQSNLAYYSYAVTAIDQLGHQSARSAETEESVPQLDGLNSPGASHIHLANQIKRYINPERARSPNRHPQEESCRKICPKTCLTNCASIPSSSPTLATSRRWRNFAPRCNHQPSLITAAAQLPQYQPIVDEDLVVARKNWAQRNGCSRRQAGLPAAGHCLREKDFGHRSRPRFH